MLQIQHCNRFPKMDLRRFAAELHPSIIRERYHYKKDTVSNSTVLLLLFQSRLSIREDIGGDNAVLAD